MPLVVRAKQLIDGTGRVLREGVVVTEGERIAYVGLAECAPELRDAEVIDLDGSILPGLIDGHVHLSWSASPTPAADFMRDSDELLAIRSAANAGRALKAGITTVRDCGSRNGVAFVLKEAIQKGIVDGPDVVVCGRPVTPTGGHCYFMNGEADGVEGVRTAVRRLVREGADFIKVMVTGGGSTPGTDQRQSSYTIEELRALVDEAHRLGRRVAAHCHGTPGIADALSAGADTVEHCSFMDASGKSRFDPKLAEAIARSGVHVIPTMSASYRYFLQRHPEQARSRIETRQALFSQMLKAGVRLATGTDAGVRYTPSDGLPLEVEFMVGAGMTPMEALIAATKVAAGALGIDNRVGTLEAGKQADLIAVDGDPLEDITALNRVSLVVKKARVARRKGED